MRSFRASTLIQVIYHIKDTLSYIENILLSVLVKYTSGSKALFLKNKSPFPFIFSCWFLISDYDLIYIS